MKKRLVILGSTGSIGRQALEVAEYLQYPVVALTAHQNIALLEEQARRFHPSYVAVTDRQAYEQLKISLADSSVKVLYGKEALCELAALPESDLVLNSLVGVAGLEPTLAALTAGKTLALANKESLVAGGALVQEALANYRGKLTPVDSEHTAIFQCLQGEEKSPIEKILLTASGGPFFGKSRKELETVSLKQALAHPRWAMGAKITVDSATLMNKGLEFIECVWNFGVTPDQIEVIVHPEAIVHSAVEFTDHSIIAQLSDPDMRLPIQYAITYPQRCEGLGRAFSLADFGALSFHKPDFDTFTCLRAAKAAIEKGGLTPCAINSANEEAVAAFLAEKISFLQIGDMAEQVVCAFGHSGSYSIQEIWETDAAARRYVREHLGIH